MGKDIELKIKIIPNGNDDNVCLDDPLKDSFNILHKLTGIKKEKLMESAKIRYGKKDELPDIFKRFNVTEREFRSARRKKDRY